MTLAVAAEPCGFCTLKYTFAAPATSVLSVFALLVVAVIMLLFVASLAVVIVLAEPLVTIATPPAEASVKTPKVEVDRLSEAPAIFTAPTA